MKTCTWCGKEYPDSAERCVTDHEPLQGGEAIEPAPKLREAVEPMPAPRWIDLHKIEGALERSEGFSKLDCEIITKVIARTVPLEAVSEAWIEAGVQWVHQLRDELGGDYQVRQSREFLLLSALEADAAGRVLRFAEATLVRINESLQDAAWKPEAGKHVILVFAEEDDYFEYVARYFRDGTVSRNSGCLIPYGYAHIALPFVNERVACIVLAHELTHCALCHLPLPVWLNEGLAKVIEHTIEPRSQPFLDSELRDRHLAYWNTDNIQTFWAGVSYYLPGDPNELSYNLGEILVRLLLEQSPEAFLEFVKHANREDAGQTAAYDFLGADLGVVAATFLGDGNWRPNRKAIGDCWASYFGQRENEVHREVAEDTNERQDAREHQTSPALSSSRLEGRSQ